MSFFEILVAEGFGGRLDEGGGSSARANQIESINRNNSSAPIAGPAKQIVLVGRRTPSCNSRTS